MAAKKRTRLKTTRRAAGAVRADMAAAAAAPRAPRSRYGASGSGALALKWFVASEGDADGAGRSWFAQHGGFELKMSRTSRGRYSWSAVDTDNPENAREGVARASVYWLAGDHVAAQLDEMMPRLRGAEVEVAEQQVSRGGKAV